MVRDFGLPPEPSCVSTRRRRQPGLKGRLEFIFRAAEGPGRPAGRTVRSGGRQRERLDRLQNQPPEESPDFTVNGFPL